MKFFKTKLSEEELKVQEIIKVFLDNKETIIDINPEDMSYQISFEKMDYDIVIDSVGVKISNHTFFKDIRLEDGVIKILKDMAYTETVIRRRAKRAKIFKNNSDLLDAIASNVSESINT